MTDRAEKNRDIAMYFAIGSIPVFIAASDPITWRTWLAALLAGITTAKAKLSPSSDKPEDK